MIKLPEPSGHHYFDDATGREVAPPVPYYTRAKLQQAIRDALEEAAKLVQDGAPPPLGEKLRHVEIGKGAREAYATAIRKLKEDTQ